MGHRTIGALGSDYVRLIEERRIMVEQWDDLRASIGAADLELASIRTNLRETLAIDARDKPVAVVCLGKDSLLVEPHTVRVLPTYGRTSGESSPTT